MPIVVYSYVILTTAIFSVNGKEFSLKRIISLMERKFSEVEIKSIDIKWEVSKIINYYPTLGSAAANLFYAYIYKDQNYKKPTKFEFNFTDGTSFNFTTPLFAPQDMEKLVYFVLHTPPKQKLTKTSS